MTGNRFPGRCDEICTDAPFEATMLYNGGSCAQSRNDQRFTFTCQDFNGGPPTNVGDQSYIIVSDGEGIIYHEGFVPVGSDYSIEGESADQRIMIYTNDPVADPSSDLLQEVGYDASCSEPVVLNDKYGASQLVGFINEEQGNVACVVPIVFFLEIGVPIDVDGDNVTLIELTAETNFAGFLVLTDLVAGVSVPPGGIAEVTVELEIDLSTLFISISFQLTATANPSGASCMGNTIFSF